MGVVIDAHLVVRRADFTLDMELTASEGEIVALLGPNGAGKSTALRALAGLLPLSSGHIRFGGEEWRHRPADQRPVGMVFQDYLLFPHLTALDNVAFGPRCQGVRKGEARRLAAEWLERVGLAEYAGRRPSALSGGQAQRVALARALAVRPRLLLLDEPLAALDVDTRREIRVALRRHLAEFDGASLLVTHDPLDAMALADRLIVIEEGRVVQEGAPAHIARRPRTDYVARLVGLNLYRGRADGHAVALDGLTFSVAEPLSGEVFLAFPPTAVALFRARPDGSPRNLWQATIGGIEPHGDQVRIHLDGPITASADITPAALADLGLADGDSVWAAVKATETHAYPA
jgi:molybdate transport system ATP-binding protein